jgi:hypothetical protein
MKMKLLFIAVTHCLTVWSYGANQRLEDRMQDVLDKGIRKYGARGVSAAIVFPDGRMWTGASGISHDTITIDPNMLFAVGSITKNVAVALTLQLA